MKYSQMRQKVTWFLTPDSRLQGEIVTDGQEPGILYLYYDAASSCSKISAILLPTLHSVLQDKFLHSYKNSEVPNAAGIQMYRFGRIPAMYD